ncbi:hypothetical protein M5689_020968 [Euphorbia peplus]|nr:hypothetical protein M5689_020968 [Euphorbia peplus]
MKIAPKSKLRHPALILPLEPPPISRLNRKTMATIINHDLLKLLGNNCNNGNNNKSSLNRNATTTIMNLMARQPFREL